MGASRALPRLAPGVVVCALLLGAAGVGAREECTEEVASLEVKLQNLKDENSKMYKAMDAGIKREAELKAAVTRADAAEKKAKKLSKKLAAAEDSLASSTDAVQSAEAERDEARGLAKAAEARATSLEKDSSSTASKQLKAAQAQLATVEKALADKDREIAELQSEKEAMHASMRRQIESLGDEADTLRAAHIQATKAAEALEAAQTVALGRVGASESALKAASAKLIAAESAALEVQQTLADAESRAVDAARRAEEVYRQAYQSWLPLWAERHYSAAVETTRPHVQRAYEAAAPHVQNIYDTAAPHVHRTYQLGRHYGSRTHSAALSTLLAMQDKTHKWWGRAKPHRDAALAAMQAKVKEAQAALINLVGPRFSDTWQASKAYIEHCLSSPQVMHARREADKVLRQLEGLAAINLRRVPALVPYARQPYLRYVVYGLLGTPFALLLLALGGGRAKGPATKPASSSASDPPAKASNKLPKKGRRITQGEDTIRVPG